MTKDANTENAERLIFALAKWDGRAYNFYSFGDSLLWLIFMKIGLKNIRPKSITASNF
jgi:hypothetical protein